MLRLLTRTLIANYRGQVLRQSSTGTAAAVPNKEKWEICAGVFVERLPLISKTLNSMEVEYQELLDQIEYENSCLSNIEVQHKQEIILAENIKKGKVNVDLETSTKITAQDSMDAWKAERNKFQLAPRTTDADKTNDVTSLHRKLEHTLVLLTEQQLGDKKYFLLPQGKLKDGETLRQTAERVLTATCGQSFNAQFWGNAPCAIYKYKYPKNAKDADAVGAKIFFFRAVYKGGNVDKKFGKFEWLDKSGVLKKLEDKQRYVRSVKPLLL